MKKTFAKYIEKCENLYLFAKIMKKVKRELFGGLFV